MRCVVPRAPAGGPLTVTISSSPRKGDPAKTLPVLEATMRSWQQYEELRADKNRMEREMLSNQGKVKQLQRELAEAVTRKADHTGAGGLPEVRSQRSRAVLCEFVRNIIDVCTTSIC